MRRSVLILFALVLAASACGDDDDTRVDAGGGHDPAGTSGADDDTVYEGTVTVLESPDHGPQLCTAVAESYPPQCSGPDVVGWDWSAVDAASASGTTWGDYHVTGTWDGGTFTLTEQPGEPQRPEDLPEPAFVTQCDTPEGGWAVVDPATATQAGLDAAQAYAVSQDDYSGSWIDQSINPAASEDPVDELSMNDPAQLVLNVMFTGDLEEHEAALRDRFGGPLCVTEAERTEAELRRIQDDVFEDVEGATSAAVDITRGVVVIGVFVADPSLQEALDAEYGTGLVELQATLQPVT